MATLHVISGLPCSGKSTYSSALRADSAAVLFSLDRWLIRAFGKYSLTEVGHVEHTRRVLACRELIWEGASELLRRSVDVILDDGFFFREHRVRHVELARVLGARAKIHFLDTPLDTIIPRLRERNADLPPFNFYIDPDSLVGFVGLLEPPASDEADQVLIVREGNPQVLVA
jgi:predicted kinase